MTINEFEGFVDNICKNYKTYGRKSETALNNLCRAALSSGLTAEEIIKVLKKRTKENINALL